MELLQLRYFLAVAEERDAARAADRLRTDGPTLSRQIAALERDLGVPLFDRGGEGGRGPVALTAAGALLLPHTRDLLERAGDVRRLAARLSGADAAESVRLGYVHWLPADPAARTAAVAPLHIDAWTAPSHTQAARVADGSLDLAVCRVTARDLHRYGLVARLIGADRLHAVTTGDATGDVRVQDAVVLLDADTTTWSSWNAYAEALARDTGARALRIADGGVTGPGFFQHARRSHRPVVNSPGGRTAALPPGLVRRPLVAPRPYWAWSLVHRRAETRPAVLAAADALTDGVTEGGLGLDGPDAWLPEGDPYRA